MPKHLANLWLLIEVLRYLRYGSTYGTYLRYGTYGTRYHSTIGS